MPAVSAFRMGKQEDQEFQIILGYLVSMKPVYTRPCLKKPKTEKERDTEREHNTREAVSEVNSVFFSVCVLS